MKSGLEGRNNHSENLRYRIGTRCLNEVRPRRPEQSQCYTPSQHHTHTVSMKSGLEGRNNLTRRRGLTGRKWSQ